MSDRYSINKLMDQTRTGYSYSAYGEDNWRKCAEYLLEVYPYNTARAILLSKYMRWAGNASNEELGDKTLEDLRNFEAKNKETLFSDKKLVFLTKETNEMLDG